MVGDIIKSLALGADFVMLGSLLAGTKETPGKIEKDKNGNMVKEFYGQASNKASEWNGSKEQYSTEGISTYVPYKGPVKPILDALKGNIQSGFSYARRQ